MKRLEQKLDVSSWNNITDQLIKRMLNKTIFNIGGLSKTTSKHLHLKKFKGLFFILMYCKM